MFTMVESPPQNAVIKVVGVGGGGGNAVRHMIESQVAGVDFIWRQYRCASAQGSGGCNCAAIGWLGDQRVRRRRQP